MHLDALIVSLNYNCPCKVSLICRSTYRRDGRASPRWAVPRRSGALTNTSRFSTAWSIFTAPRKHSTPDSKRYWPRFSAERSSSSSASRCKLDLVSQPLGFGRARSVTEAPYRQACHVKEHSNTSSRLVPRQRGSGRCHPT